MLLQVLFDILYDPRLVNFRISRYYFMACTITILICLFVSLENGLEREPDNTEVEP